MSTTDTPTSSADRLLDTIQSAERSTVEAVRRFVDTVDGAVPDVGDEQDGPRRQIIDAAFSMVESLVGASNDLARNVVDVTARALREGTDET